MSNPIPYNNLYDFLAGCGGNWRNALFISCSPCIHPCQNKRAGCLLSASSTGRPQVMTVSRFERLTGQKVDPSECLGKIKRDAFEAAYAQYLVWQIDSANQCSLQQLDLQYLAP